MKEHEVDDTVSDEMMVRMRPFAEVFPMQAEAFAKRRRGQRGPGKSQPKRQISLRIDPDVIEAYRDSGAGWQARMNDVLRAGIGNKTI